MYTALLFRLKDPKLELCRTDSPEIIFSACETIKIVVSAYARATHKSRR
jgi:hypothetical protein